MEISTGIFRKKPESTGIWAEEDWESFLFQFAYRYEKFYPFWPELHWIDNYGRKVIVYEEMYSLSIMKVISCRPKKIFLVHQAIVIEVL